MRIGQSSIVSTPTWVYVKVYIYNDGSKIPSEGTQVKSEWVACYLNLLPFNPGYPRVMTNIAVENHHAMNGKTHHLYGHCE